MSWDEMKDEEVLALISNLDELEAISSEEITGDFVKGFSSPSERFAGGVCKFLAMGHIPIGVNPKDKRVIEIVKKCIWHRKEVHA